MSETNIDVSTSDEAVDKTYANFISEGILSLPKGFQEPMLAQLSSLQNYYSQNNINKEDYERNLEKMYNQILNYRDLSKKTVQNHN